MRVELSSFFLFSPSRSLPNFGGVLPCSSSRGAGKLGASTSRPSSPSWLLGANARPQAPHDGQPSHSRCRCPAAEHRRGLIASICRRLLEGRETRAVLHAGESRCSLLATAEPGGIPAGCLRLLSPEFWNPDPAERRRSLVSTTLASQNRPLPRKANPGAGAKSPPPSPYTRLSPEHEAHPKGGREGGETPQPRAGTEPV